MHALGRGAGSGMGTLRFLKNILTKYAFIIVPSLNYLMLATISLLKSEGAIRRKLIPALTGHHCPSNSTRRNEHC